MGQKRQPRYVERTYRRTHDAAGLVTFEVKVKQTDLFIRAQRRLDRLAREVVLELRAEIEEHIAEHPEFATSLAPLACPEMAPLIVDDMCAAALAAGVGPMAAVAGAIAHRVALELSLRSNEVIVENGGDVFLTSWREQIVSVFAGESPLSGKVALRVPMEAMSLAVCCSSGTVGPSLSLGRADAAVVAADDGALADAAATAVGNRVKGPADVEAAVEVGRGIRGVRHVLVIAGETMGAWGELELVPLGHIRTGRNAHE